MEKIDRVFAGFWVLSGLSGYIDPFQKVARAVFHRFWPTSPEAL